MYGKQYKARVNVSCSRYQKETAAATAVGVVFVVVVVVVLSYYIRLHN